MRRLVFDQSSPGHHVSESRGCGLSVTKDGRRTEDERKSLCLILDTDRSFTLPRKPPERRRPIVPFLQTLGVSLHPVELQAQPSRSSNCLLYLALQVKQLSYP